MIQFNQLCIQTTFPFHKLQMNAFHNFKIHIIWFLFSPAGCLCRMASLYPVPPLKGQARSARTHLSIFFVSLKDTMAGGEKEHQRTNSKLSSLHRYVRAAEQGTAASLNFPVDIFLSQNKENSTTTYLQFPKCLVITLSHLILTTTL